MRLTKPLLTTVIGSIIATSAIAADLKPSQTDSYNPIISGYYGNWMSKDIGASNIQNLDVLNYAFLGLNADGHITLLSPNLDIGTLIQYGSPSWQNLPIPAAITAWQQGVYDYVNGSGSNSETLVLGGKFKRLGYLKQMYPNLKILFVVGGWTGSTNYSTVAADPQLRKTFAMDVVNIIKNFTYTDAKGVQQPIFDGVDLDWEYPVSGGNGINHNSEDGYNFYLLVKDIRGAMNTYLDNSRHYYITLATPHGIGQPDGGSITNIDFKSMFAGDTPIVDHINMMAYDFANGMTTTSFLAPLNYLPSINGYENPIGYSSQAQSIDMGVQELRDNGVPLNKIVMGAPLYSSHWNVTDINNAKVTNGLFQPATFVNNDTTYESLINNIIRPLNKDIYQVPNVFFNNQAEATFYYDLTKGDFYSFDGPRDIQNKANYIHKNGLGGMMFWEITGDAQAPFSLTTLARQLIKGDNPTPPENPGQLTFCNSDPNAWYNMYFDMNQNGSYQKVDQAALAPANSSSQPYCVTFQAYYGQASPSMQVEIQNVATAKPEYATCSNSDGTPLTVNLKPNTTIYVKGSQDPSTKKTTCTVYTPNNAKNS